MSDDTTTAVGSDRATASGPGRVGGRGKLRAVGVAAGLLIAGLAASIVFGVAFTVPLLLFGSPLTGSTEFLAFAAVGQFALLAVGVVYVRRTGGVTVRWPTQRDLRYAVGGLFGALGLVLGLSVVASVAGVAPSGSVFDDPIAADPIVALGLAVLSIVLVAPAEELLFRGAIQGRLRRVFGPVGAVAGASLLFGSIHVLNYTGSVVGAAVGVGLVSVGGAVFGAIYERTGNLVVPILAHGGYNTVLLVAAFLAA